MNIHEYQGKEVLRQYGVAVPNGKVAFTVDEAVEAAKDSEQQSLSSKRKFMRAAAVKPAELR